MEVKVWVGGCAVVVTTTTTLPTSTAAAASELPAAASTVQASTPTAMVVEFVSLYSVILNLGNLESPHPL